MLQGVDAVAAPAPERWWRNPALQDAVLTAAFILAVWIVPDAAARLLSPLPLFDQLFREGGDRILEIEDLRGMSAKPLWAPPDIGWVNIAFDKMTGSDNRPLSSTPPTAIAKVLDWIRTSPGPGARLVFLDIAVPDQPETLRLGEVRPLVEALERWNEDPRSPPLTIAAGAACTPPDSTLGQTSLFRSGAYASQVFPTGAAGGLRVAWSCPVFIKSTQKFWSCVTSAGDTSATIALPSTAWIGWSVQGAGAAFTGRLSDDLKAADIRCRNVRDATSLSGSSGLPIPQYSHLRYSFDPFSPGLTDRAQALVVRRADAGPIIDGESYSHAAIDGRIVVISSSPAPNDTFETSRGVLPGPLMVAEALREGWAWGPPRQAPGWALPALGSALIVLGMLLTCWRGSGLRRNGGPLHFLSFFVSHPHVTGFVSGVAMVVGALAIPGALSDDRMLEAGVIIILIELFFAISGFMREWHHERLGNIHGVRPVGAGVSDAGGADLHGEPPGSGVTGAP